MPAAAMKHARRAVPAIAFALIALVGIVYAETLKHGFVNFDDDAYVYQNPQVTGGLTLRSVAWAFTHAHARNWHPLTTLSHMLDCDLFGLNPAGHHFINVLLHGATAALLFLALWRLTQALWSSAFVAAVFALHPLRVESVAWVAERKDVLSAFFFALTVLAYIRYARSGRGYAWVVLSFLLGLLSKPMLVTLPLILLLLDYWPLDRLRRGTAIITEKLPLFALSLASCIATFAALRSSTGAMSAVPLGWRLKNAIVSAATYLGQMLLPRDLAVFYPYPATGGSWLHVVAAGAVLVAISAVVFVLRKRQPWLATGWLWYVIMLLPVIGIVQIGLQSHADRYTYLPQIGLYFALTWTAVAIGGRRRALLTASAVAILVCFGAITFHQVHFWRDSRTLWTHAAEVTGDNEAAENNLGILDSNEGKLESAIAHYERAIAIQEARGATRYDLTVALAENNLGNALAQKGEVNAAVLHCARAVELRPDYADGYFNLGVLLLQQRRIEEAIDALRAVTRLRPDDAAAHDRLGDALHAKGADAAARVEYETAVRLAPNAMWATYSLGWLLATSSDERVRDGERASEIALQTLRSAGGESTPMLRVLAAADATQERFDDALNVTSRAIDLALMQGDAASARALERDMALYRQRIPIREITRW